MSVLLEAGGVSFARGGAQILREASVRAGAGEFIGVIGPNGAGKTTLLRLLAGVEKPDAGEVRVTGEPLASLTPIVRARRIAYLPQARPVYWSIDVERLVALGRFAYGAHDRLQGADAAAVEAALATAGVAHLKSRAATSLSGGEAARAHLARALAAEAPILLADEPTAALDPKHQLAIMTALAERARKGLVIAALHDLALATRFCTRIVLIEDGRITEDGLPGETLSADNLARAFGVAARLDVINGQTVIGFSLPSI